MGRLSTAMRLIAIPFRPSLQPQICNTFRQLLWNPQRGLMTLAIETSCDDTSVAVVEKDEQNGQAVAWLHFHKKVTSNNLIFQGVHPLVSLRSHQESLATLVNEAISSLPMKEAKQTPMVKSESSVQPSERRLPDFISVTRGPGMRSNLFTGLDTAKGLAVAWQIPLVGVHHMQAHALTPRLVSALEASHERSGEAMQTEVCTDDQLKSSTGYPFLSVLASGGHTMLIKSSSLTEHEIMGNTNDIAIGDCLDKAARVILPAEVLRNSKTTMYASLLEPFAIGNENAQQEHVKTNQVLGPATANTYLEAHKDRYKNWTSESPQDAMQKTADKWGWTMAQPLSKASGGIKANTFEMSFSGLATAVERLVKFGNDPLTGKTSKIERSVREISPEERKDMAMEVMRASFEHVASRVILGLQSFQGTSMPSLVLAGGVAANSFFRYILAKSLCAREFSDLVLQFPPAELCTDNAAMIGWAGLEMFEAGHHSPLNIRAIRKWPLDQLMNPQDDG